ncbi:hypothetical protein JNW90_24260 [Micromonospora sp. STR1s_5]|nr:hypothetical protein [Micromonospora sp. STR1s_5]
MDDLLSGPLGTEVRRRLADTRQDLLALLRRGKHYELAKPIELSRQERDPARAERRYENVATATDVHQEVTAAARAMADSVHLLGKGNLEGARVGLRRAGQRMHAYRCGITRLVWVDPSDDQVVTGGIGKLADALAVIERAGLRLAAVHEAHGGHIFDRPWSILRDRDGRTCTISVTASTGTVECVYHIS